MVVDAALFSRALAPTTELPPEIADRPRALLGRHGVVDERLDLGLLGALARRHPDRSVVAVGPVAKLAPEKLPIAPNLRSVGRQPFAYLPACPPSSAASTSARCRARSSTRSARSAQPSRPAASTPTGALS